MIALSILAAASIAVPIAGSLALCVPKRYRRVISPRLPNTPQWWDDFPEPDGTSWYMAPFRLLIVLGTLPAFIVFLVVAKYWVSVMSLIERKCPYTPKERVTEHDSQTSVARRFRATPKKGFAGLWGFPLGR